MIAPASKMLPETGQALLFDKQRGNHVVASIGDNIEGYLVDWIEDDEVILVAEEDGTEVILAAPMDRKKRGVPPSPSVVAPAAAASTAEP